MTTLPKDLAAHEIGPGLAGFWRALPREGRFLLSTVALQHLGRGMTLPFTVIYLHEVRGFSLDTAGSIMALLALVAALAAAPMGALTDLLGARWMLIVAGVCQSLGAVALAFATSLPIAVLGAVLMLAFVIGIGQAWARGLTIDCGCFGGGGQVSADETRYGREIARDLALALCGAWLVLRPASTLSLDRALFGPTKEHA